MTIKKGNKAFMTSMGLLSFFFCFLFAYTHISPIAKELILNKYGTSIETKVNRYDYQLLKQRNTKFGHYKEVDEHYITVSYLGYEKTFKIHRDMKKGDKVTIIYLPNNPTYSIVRNYYKSIWDILGLTSFWGNFLNLIIFVISTGFFIAGLVLFYLVLPERISMKLFGGVVESIIKKKESVVKFNKKHVLVSMGEIILHMNIHSIQHILLNYEKNHLERNLDKFLGRNPDYYREQISNLNMYYNFFPLFLPHIWLIFNGFYFLGFVVTLLLVTVAINIGYLSIGDGGSLKVVTYSLIFIIILSFILYYRGNEIIIRKACISADKNYSNPNYKERTFHAAISVLIIALLSAIAIFIRYMQ